MVRYEWVVEETESSGDIIENYFYGANEAKEAVEHYRNKNYKPDKDGSYLELDLKRYYLCPRGMTEVCRLNIVNGGELPEFFEDGTKVPKYLIKQYEKAVA